MSNNQENKENQENQKNKENKEDKYVILQCPNCEEFVFIYKKEFNCKIFRHAYYKSNHKQIDPHLSKEVCDNLLKENKIYGCSKPFKLIENNQLYKLEKCDYI